MHRTGITSSGFLIGCRQTIKEYPKEVAAIVVALLLGASGGVSALASFGPDLAQAPLREVLESVQSLPLPAMSDDHNHETLKLYRSELTRSSDTPRTLLRRMGVDDGPASAFLSSDAAARQLFGGPSGRSVTVEAGDNQKLLKLTARWSISEGRTFTRLVVERNHQGFHSKMETAALSVSTRLASAVVRTSLHAAALDASIPDGIVTQLINIFSQDLDLRRDLRTGDRFSVVYESLDGDDEFLRIGRILSAEIVSRGRSYQAMWFQSHVGDENSGTDILGTSLNNGRYFRLDGHLMGQQFLASPLLHSVVTSGFAMRFDPVLKKMISHTGVDYAAPTGTEVHAIGDGAVEFAGVENGYGNVVVVNHGNQRTTVYAHLSKIDVERGQIVSKGQSLGAVGSSGWATGPHLHFEFLIDGKFQNPLAMVGQSESVRSTASVNTLFQRAAAETRVALGAAASMQGTNTQ